MVTPTDGRLWREIVEVVMKRSLIVLTLVFAMSLALALPASAVTTTWNFTGGPGDVNLGNAGTVFTATDNVTQLTAQGFAFNSAPIYGVSAGNALDLHLNAQGLGPRPVGFPIARPTLSTSANRPSSSGCSSRPRTGIQSVSR